MAENSIRVDAPPQRVFEVLSDPRCYPEWIVGARDIRTWDPEFPAPGSAFHHTVRVGPVSVDDSTSVLEAEPPRRLLLRARARPAGIAHVELEVLPEDGATRVVMRERPVEGVGAAIHNPVNEWLLRRRNDESLRRLKRLAERR